MNSCSKIHESWPKYSESKIGERSIKGIIQRLGPLYEGGDTDWEGLVEAQSWVATLDTFDTVDTQPVIEALLDNSLPNVDPLLEQTTDALSQYDEAAEFFEGAMAVEEMMTEWHSTQSGPPV